MTIMNTLKTRTKFSFIVLVMTIAGTVVWSFLLALDLIPGLRGTNDWSYMFEGTREPLRLLPFTIGSLGYLGVGAWLMNRKHPAGLLIWSVTGTVGLTLAGIYIKESPFFKLFGLTVAPDGTGWHIAAAAIVDLGKTLRDWPAYMVYAYKYSYHLFISPPGAVVFYYGLIQLLQGLPGIAHLMSEPLRQIMCQNFTIAEYSDAQLAAAWAGILMPLWSGLTVLPLYSLGKRLIGQRAARWSVLWWPLIPSVIMFTGTLNTFFPFPTVCLVLLLLEGLALGKWWLVVLAGILASVMTFVNFVFFPLIFLAGMLVLLHYFARTSLYKASAEVFAPKRAPWLWPFNIGMLFGIGLLSVWVVYDAFFGVTFFDILRTSAASHLVLDRPYFAWLFLHLYDYFMFTGWPLVVVAALSVIAVLRTYFRHKRLDNAGVLLISVFVTLITLDLSGTLRGETGRLLVFFTPFFLCGAGWIAESSSLEGNTHAVWLLTVAQVFVVGVMLSSLHVMGLVWNTPSPIAPPLQNAESPLQSIPSGATFDHALRLIGFSGVIQSVMDARPISPTLDLWLEWQATGRVNYPYWLSLLPVAPDGTVGQSTLHQPFENRFPTTCWAPSTGVIREHVKIIVPASFKDGAYWVSLALMDRSGNRTEVLMPDGSRDDQTGLGPFVR